MTSCSVTPSRDHLGNGQAIAAIANGDLGDQAKMAGDELMRRVAVAVLAPALGQHELFLRFQHREPPDLFWIPGEAGFARQNGQGCGSGQLIDPPYS